MKYWFIVLLSIQLAVSQNPYPQDYFNSPLEIPIILSGTFGELRNNHFHSGMDIKTQQTEGLKVLAAADGYVSRIKIAHYGYGKALYITHPNGYTTVYAHLQKLAPKLEAYLKKEQYQREIFEIELFPLANELQVTQGEVIAYSGNTGSSGGPHLHYEIRDNLERPINPMLFGLIPRDSKAPVIQNIYVYPKDKYSYINGKNQRKELRIIPKANNAYEVEPFTAFGTIGFGITSHDLLDLAANKNGVSNITTHLNGVKNFEIDFKKFSFDETSHLNRFIDYEHYKTKRSLIQKLFLEPNNPLSLFKDVIDNGYIKVTDSTHSIYKILVSDFAGNKAQVHISIDGEKQSLPEQNSNFEVNPDLRYVYANQAKTMKYQHVTINIPANTFYEDVNLKFKVTGDTLKLHEDIIPLQNNIGIHYDASGYDEVDKNKLFIARLVGYRKYPIHLPTKKVNNILSAYTKTLGEFTLKYDTTAPQVVPVNWQNGKWLSKYRYLKIKITDDLSGISSYRATVNGKFILMEYDYKTNTLTHDFNDNVVTDTRNELKLIVVDNVGNSTTFEATFFRK